MKISNSLSREFYCTITSVKSNTMLATHGIYVHAYASNKSKQ